MEVTVNIVRSADVSLGQLAAWNRLLDLLSERIQPELVKESNPVGRRQFPCCDVDTLRIAGAQATASPTGEK